MKAESEAIVSFLDSQTSFTSEMSDRVFPLVAGETTEYPFATYRIITSEGQSKDGDKALVVLSLWYEEDNYTECVAFSDVVESLIKQNFDWLSTDVDYIEKNQSFVANINFEIT